MNISPSKENILKKIRKALSHSTPLPFPDAEGNSPVFTGSTQELELEFAEQFTRLQGKFIFCVNRQELVKHLNELVEFQRWKGIYCADDVLQQKLIVSGFNSFAQTSLGDSEAALTTCEALVARTGSIVMSSAQAGGRTVSVYSPVHICIATTSQLVYDIKDALQVIKSRFTGNLPSLITFATGPSRTADIEKTLVVGVHGPGEVYCFLCDESW
jgi:L-lactate dehydrogenase complex protein LldG